MKKDMKYPYIWALPFTLCLILYTTFTLLEAFVLPSDVVRAEDQTSVSTSASDSDNSSAVITDSSYKAYGISITITEKTLADTQVYIADIYLDNPSVLLSGLADGRTSESEGLTLYQLARVMQDLGCSEAYNLDGGGSTTMYFNGQVINNPTTTGRSIKERSVSDIIYIAG